jgi:glycine oxidase
MKVVIIGAGVMGLMTARELAKAHCEVVLLERAQPGQEASWAGGGIVSPLYPWRYSAPVTALASVAQQAYPALAEELLSATGIDPELTCSGLLMLDAEDARDAEVWAGMHRHKLVRWQGADLQRQLPGLAAHWRGGLWMPEIANIRNPRLLKALCSSLAQLNVITHEQVEVQEWHKEPDGRVTAVSAGDGRRFEGDAFVVCSGAWSRQVLEAGGNEGLPVRPVRGQMLLYRQAAGSLPCIVMAEGRYVIPRRDGHILCGSTLEESGFDKSTTAQARSSLIASAGRLWPALAGREPIAHWAGLRPGAPNGIPFIGAVPGSSNLWVNAGQYRNGLVLAPASARLLADLLLGRDTQLDARPYQFSGVSAPAAC